MLYNSPNHEMPLFKALNFIASRSTPIARSPLSMQYRAKCASLPISDRRHPGIRSDCARIGPVQNCGTVTRIVVADSGDCDFTVPPSRYRRQALHDPGADA